MRFENKYFVPYALLDELRASIWPFVRLDQNAETPDGGSGDRPGGYTVRSIYFDTPAFDCYWTKVSGEANRLKVRLRGYRPTAPVFFEIKRKYEAPIMKNRASTSFENALKMFENEPVSAFFDENQQKSADNASRFFYQIHARRMRPVVNVIYEREPYMPKTLDLDNDCRITIDKNLRSVAWPRVDQLFDDSGGLRWALNGCFILEIKFNRYCPSWIKQFLEDYGLRKEAASKYCVTIDSHPTIRPQRKNETLLKAAF